MARVGLERASVLAYGALRVGGLVVEVSESEARPHDRVVGLRRERVFVELARVGERSRVAAAARDEEVRVAGHHGRLVVFRVGLVRALQYARDVRQYRGVPLLPRVDVERLPDLLLQLGVGGACVGLRDGVLQLVFGERRERVVVALARLRLRPLARVGALRGAGGLCTRDFGAQPVLLLSVDAVRQREADDEAEDGPGHENEDGLRVDGRFFCHRSDFFSGAAVSLAERLFKGDAYDSRGPRADVSS